MKPPVFKTIAGFVLLFACYHTAEYFILYRHSAAGFLTISGLFFLSGFIVSKWQGDKTMNGWGLAVKKSFPVYFLTGLLTGLAVSTLLFLSCLFLDIEVVSFVPPLHQFLPQAALLIFGCAISSLTEDVLTRGYIFRHAGHRWTKSLVVAVSALVYGLNHIHRLDEPVYFLYALVLGIQLALPLLLTGNIWYTFGVHWAGNIVYHLTNSVMHTAGGSNAFPPIAMAIIFALLSIPLHLLVCRQLVLHTAAGNSPSLQRHSSAFMRHSSGLI